LAAKTWSTDRDTLTAEDGRVSDRGANRSIEYGRLARGQKLMKSIDGAPVTTAQDWRVCGKPAAKVDGRAMVTGGHRFASDIKRPGMMYGRVLRPSKFEATLESVDTREAAAMPGVTVVHDGDFVGVAASTGESASKALGAIRAEWKAADQPSGRE